MREKIDKNKLSKEKHRELIGVPKIGRQEMQRLIKIAKQSAAKDKDK